MHGHYKEIRKKFLFVINMLYIFAFVDTCGAGLREVRPTILAGKSQVL